MIFLRLWVMLMRFHSILTPSIHLKENLVNPRWCLILAKTGSTSCCLREKSCFHLSVRSLSFWRCTCLSSSGEIKRNFCFHDGWFLQTYRRLLYFSCSTCGSFELYCFCFRPLFCFPAPSFAFTWDLNMKIFPPLSV